MKRYLGTIAAALLVSSCASTGMNEGNDFLRFNSNDWLLERFKKNRSNPLNVEVRVKQDGTRRYNVMMTFRGDPQDPVRGINPTAVSILSFCVNSYIANKSGNDEWVAGMRADGYSARERNYRLIVGNFEQLETKELAQDYTWSKPVRISQNQEQCRGMIRGEYTW